MQTFDPFWVEHGYGTPVQGFQNLARFRVRDILLVSSLYDSYLFEEDGRLYELIRNEYQGLNLESFAGTDAGIERERCDRAGARGEPLRYDHHDAPYRRHARRCFARMVREAGLKVPIVVLAYDNRELTELFAHHDTSVFDRVFIWQGDFRIIIAIIKYVEDRLNVDNDTRLQVFNRSFLLKTMSRFYSSYLPLIYTETLKQSQRLISEGINLSDKFLRMRRTSENPSLHNIRRSVGILPEIPGPHSRGYLGH